MDGQICHNLDVKISIFVKNSTIKFFKSVKSLKSKVIVFLGLLCC